MRADDSHEISYLIFSENLGKMLQNLLSASVVIGALRVKYSYYPSLSDSSKGSCQSSLTVDERSKGG